MACGYESKLENIDLNKIAKGDPCRAVMSHALWVLIIWFVHVFINFHCEANSVGGATGRRLPIWSRIYHGSCFIRLSGQISSCVAHHSKLVGALEISSFLNVLLVKTYNHFFMALNFCLWPLLSCLPTPKFPMNSIPQLYTIDG